MSYNTPDELQAAVNQLRTRIEVLRHDVALRTRKTEDRNSIHLAIGGLVMVLIVVSFTFLTNMAFRLDAEALTQIGRHKVEQNLPQGREALSKYLEERAPSVTSQLLWALVGALPELRPVVLRELDGELQRLAGNFEKDVTQVAEAAVKSAKEDLDAKYPGLDDTEKMDRLITAVTRKFNENVATLYAGLYPQYSREMQRVDGYLKRLRDKDPTQLTDRERTEREMIETILRLITLEGAK